MHGHIEKKHGRLHTSLRNKFFFNRFIPKKISQENCHLFVLNGHGLHVFATLALGSQPRQRLVKVWAKCEVQESHFMILEVWESVRK
jgi:hypothetical protein